jgi:hypothetical protein
MATKLAHKLTEGTVIAFSMGGNPDDVKVATVRSVEVMGKYVTVWFRELNEEIGFFLADKTSKVEVMLNKGVRN